MNEKIDKYFKLLHPEYDTLEPEKQIELMDDRDFIVENIDEIDKYYQECMNPRSGAQQMGMTEEKIMQDAILYTKVEKYYELAYGKRDKEDIELALKNGHKDKMFILEHIGDIDKYYQEYMDPRSGAQQERLTGHEIIENVLRKVKIGKYFELLHPEYETLTPGEQLRTMRDKSFIEDHIDEIDEMYTTYVSQAERRGEEINAQEVIATAVNLKKTDKYFELLHPEYETLTPGEKLRTMRDKSFIEDHIDEIDEMYTTYVSQAERRGEEVNTQEVIKRAIEGVQDLQTTFSAQKIGQATINTPTTAKKEAEQVENGENTKDKIKKGEEVGDDN